MPRLYSGQAINTLFDPEEVLEIIRTQYSLDTPQTCRLIRRGFNDHYQITAGNTRYIFRVYLNGKYYIDSAKAFQFEVDLVDYLHKRKIPVAYPVPRKYGGLLGWASTPLGERATALFSYALGEEVSEGLLSTAQRFELGKTVATFHLTANSFHSEHGRYHLNLKYLVEEPLRLIAQQDNDEIQKVLASLQPIDALVDAVEALTTDGDKYGIIHGDLHAGNMHFQGNRVTLFDFDHCAYGWRAYDLATIYNLPETQQKAFFQGYEAIRPLTEGERDCLPVFAKLRTLWDVGDIIATEAVRAEPSR